MKPFVCIITAYAVLLASLPTAYAQEVPTPPDIPPGNDRIEHVEAGAAAPYEGMLLDMDTAIRWTNRLRWWPETYRLRLREAGELRVAEQGSYETRIRIVTESFTREIEGLRSDLREQAQRYEEQLERLRNPPFWETGWFGFTMGVVLMGLAVGAGVIIAVQ